MALVLSEEQIMLRDAASDFLNSRAPVSHLRALRDSGETLGYSPELWTEMVDMGWASILIPEAYGGLQYGHTGMGIVLEQCGRTLTPSPLISTALMGVDALLLSNNTALCSQWLPLIATGEKLISLAVEESSRHRPGHVDTTAGVVGDGYILSGSKCAVMDGKVADAFIVSARTCAQSADCSGVSLFLVPADSDGLRLKTTEVLDNRHLSSLEFEKVQLTPEQLLGTLHHGSSVLEDILDRGRIGMAAEMLGIAQECFERTTQYLKERKQFGVHIGSFQALQHRAANLFGEIELCKSVVLKALQAIDENSDEVPLLASLAKLKCGSVAELATAEAIQMHGGIGMTDQFDLGFFIKRWRSLNQQLGDSRFHLDRLATLRAY